MKKIQKIFFKSLCQKLKRIFCERSLESNSDEHSKKIHEVTDEKDQKEASNWSDVTRK